MVLICVWKKNQGVQPIGVETTTPKPPFLGGCLGMGVAKFIASPYMKQLGWDPMVGPLPRERRWDGRSVSGM